jgi:hypothetical protein
MRLGRLELGAASLLALVVGCRRPPLADGDNQAAGTGGNQAAGTGGGPTGTAGGTGAGGAPSGQFCAAFASDARPINRPDALLLLDASGSINETPDGTVCDGGCGARSRWAEASAALNDLVAATETSVNWGLKLFPDGGGACAVTGRLAVPIAAGSAAAISTAIASRTDTNGGLTRAGNTPTRLAEQTAASSLAALDGEGRKVIVLVTHGAPNCGSGGQATDDSPATVEEIARTRAAGILTIVVGITPPGGPPDATLADMATAGGSARAAASPAYTPLSAVGDLAGTLAALTVTAIECVYRLPQAPTSDPMERPIGVQVDGIDVARDRSHVSGWDYTDASFTAVRIFGPICSEIQEGGHRTVTIGFYCHGTL